MHAELIYGVAAAGALISAYMGIPAAISMVKNSFFSPAEPIVEAIPEFLPWEVTGWPVKSAEIWRMRVCKAHHTIHAWAPHTPPAPLHWTLGLDPNAHPFNLPQQSHNEGQPLYNAVKTKIFHAMMDKTAAASHRIVQEGSVTSDAERMAMDIYVSVASILMDDLARDNYAREFVPKLGPEKGDRKKEAHVLVKKYFEILKKLCE